MKTILLLIAGLSADQATFFEARIRPVLAEKCYGCHSQQAGKVKGGLLLDTRAATLQGGDNGPAIVPGDAEASLLIQALRWQDADTGMPPKNKGGKLPDSVLADFEQWVNMGAPDPRDGDSPIVKTDAPETAKSWWAYQPVKRPEVPSPKNSTWAFNDIDRFLLAALEQDGSEPAADVDAATLTRRLYLDLTGLPPPADVDTSNPDRLIGQLLETRQFAERWARHWLDVSRYAETTGRDVNVTQPEAWRYRDYVIDAFARDMPFDQFIREQIAGDLLPDSGDPDRASKLIATGFLAIGPKGLNNTDPRQFAVDLADEQIDAVSQAFLGLTISCARCHDHKFDPITQRDYTALAGIFLSSETRFGTVGGVQGRNASALIEVPDSAGLPILNRRMDPSEWSRKKAEFDSLTARRDAALASLRRNPGAEGQMSGFEMVRLITRTGQVGAEIDRFHPDGTLRTRVMGVLDKPVTAPERVGRNTSLGGPNSRGRRSSGFESIADSPFFVRGSIDKENGTIPRGLPEFLSRGQSAPMPSDSSGRLELAEWIASPDNTLTARVIVNRVWHWIWGRGLVESVDNFGASGSTPSNPDLLDHLATEFVTHGWSLKKLIQTIVGSHAYRMQREPRRLDAETIRDAMLAASGALDPSPQAGSLIAMAGDGPIGGDRFQVMPEEAVATANGRYRSLYLPIARSVQPEVLSVFDFTDPNTVMGARETTLVAPQALYLMNSDFVAEQASLLARRVMAAGEDFETRFRHATQLVFSRAPRADELAAARRLDRGDSASWTSICRALFCSADFLFLP